MGQAAHFVRYASESVPYGVNRYTAECRRLFHVLEKQLVSFIRNFDQFTCLLEISSLRLRMLLVQF